MFAKKRQLYVKVKGEKSTICYSECPEIHFGFGIFLNPVKIGEFPFHTPTLSRNYPILVLVGEQMEFTQT